ncbi:MAG: redoxin family protein [Rhizobiales bacterium]|nr:redoxin family protein [Hyphomicrobiales bacterium]
MTPAPELFTQQWFNVPAPITLASLRGKVVVLHAFQMLCPGCVKSALPQAQRIAEIFSPDKVAVIGIHTVFEHHAAMPPVALDAFLHEYRISFPVAVDVPGEDSPIPQTMAAYGMQGTPTMVLIDRAGNIRRQTLGTEDDLRVGADIALLTAESWNG